MGTLSHSVTSLARQAWRRVPDRPRNWALMMRDGAPADRQWLREVMNREFEVLLRSLPPNEHDAVEVSGGRLRSQLPWRSYTSLDFPDFDLCGDQPSQSFDIVMCEQVLEHVPHLTKAVANLKALCRPGGRLLVSTPFLVKIHAHPDDFWRFTPSGLRILLEEAGFCVEWVHSWGSRACAIGNLRRWAPYRPWRSLKNEPDFPMVVWALARRVD